MAENITLMLLAGSATLAVFLTFLILKIPITGLFKIDISVGLRGLSVKVMRSNNNKNSKGQK